MQGPSVWICLQSNYSLYARERNVDERNPIKMHYYRIVDNIIETDTVEVDFGHLGGVGNVMFSYMKKHGAKTAQVSPFSCSLEWF